MASIGGTITHSPNTSGSDICWVLFHSSDINPIHQLFCQLPLSGLRGDCSFGGSEYWFILAPHLLLTKFDWIFFSLPSSYFPVPWVAYCPAIFPSLLTFLFIPVVISVSMRSSVSVWIGTFSGQYPLQIFSSFFHLFSEYTCIYCQH